MHYLSVGAIFKNESVALVEWVEHYLREGVEHFYLIDNGSTDDSIEKIKPYMDQGLVTLFSDSKKWAQVELYNTYFKNLESETKWMLICDLDEFVYSRRSSPTIAAFLKRQREKVGAIRIPWKVFGSSGLIEQPESIIQSFKKRANYKGELKNWSPDKKQTLSKVIVKTSYVDNYQIHFCRLKPGARVISARGKRLPYQEAEDSRNFQPSNEKMLKKSFLHLNHYPIQSLDWFMEVKSRRGAADHQNHDAIRDQAYFEEFDQHANELIDDELANKEY